LKIWLQKYKVKQVGMSQNLIILQSLKEMNR